MYVVLLHAGPGESKPRPASAVGICGAAVFGGSGNKSVSSMTARAACWYCLGLAGGMATTLTMTAVPIAVVLLGAVVSRRISILIAMELWSCGSPKYQALLR